MAAGRPTSQVQKIVDLALRGQLDEAQAKKVYELGPEAVLLILLAATQHILEQQKRIAEQEQRLATLEGQEPQDTPDITPATPSGMIPVYAKPPAAKRRKRPGAKKGHPGSRRATPERIDRRESHRLKRCPDCNGRVQRCHRPRTRIIEDIPEQIQPVVTEHTIHRDYCPKCKKDVEPIVDGAMPKATLGHHVIALTSWFHFGLGLTVGKIIEILKHPMQTKLSAGGLVQAWHRLAEALKVWYEQIAEEARKSAVLHADETGWRVNGVTYWLWCFTNDQSCFYMIDRCRGSPALLKFFIECFDGVLITDFWSAYESVCAEDRQYCLVHLLRELEKVDQRNESAKWQAFAKRLRRLIRDAIRLRCRKDFVPGKFQSKVNRLNDRLVQLANAACGDGGVASDDADVKRLGKRLRKHAEYILTFLDYANVPYENNHAERQIRPAVIIRKNSLSNRSERGAETQAILMTIYRTLRLRGLNPTKTIANALRTYVATGKLPSIKDAAIADG